jgi:hypothetical protein
MFLSAFPGGEKAGRPAKWPKIPQPFSSMLYTGTTPDVLVLGCAVTAASMPPNLAPALAEAAARGPSQQEELSLLFIQQAKAGKLVMDANSSTNGSLILTGVARHTVWFADRPARTAGQVWFALLEPDHCSLLCFCVGVCGSQWGRITGHDLACRYPFLLFCLMMSMNVPVKEPAEAFGASKGTQNLYKQTAHHWRHTHKSPM